MSTVTKAAWADRRCPIIDGVLFADGRIIVLEITPLEDGRVLVRALLESTIDSYLDHNADGWMSLVRCAKCSIDETSQQVVVGEASMGSDGFVALCDASDNLVWVLISQISDPFCKVSYDRESDTIAADSTSGHTWRIPRERPHEVTVVER